MDFFDIDISTVDIFCFIPAFHAYIDIFEVMEYSHGNVKFMEIFVF